MTSRVPLRVLIVTIVHDPEDARIRHRQLGAMLDAGFQVTYAAPFHAYRRNPPAGVRVVDLPRAHGRRRLRALRAARREIRRLAPQHDVVLLHDPDLLLAVAGRRPRGATVVWDVHEDTAGALRMREWLPRPLRRVAAAGVRLAERWADRNLAIMLAEESYRARFSQGRPVVPNSVRVPAARSTEVEPRLVYLGKVTAARGGHELVELARRLPDVTVEVLGPAVGDMEPVLAAAHRDGVLDWRGFVPNDEALRHLPGALAGVSLLHDEPNYAHSRPTKVMEYMAAGLPVITTPNPASARLVEEADCGYVVDFGDVPAAVQAVRRLQEDAALRERFGAKAHAAALEHLSWERDAPAFLEFLLSVSGTHHGTTDDPTTKD